MHARIKNILTAGIITATLVLSFLSCEGTTEIDGSNGYPSNVFNNLKVGQQSLYFHLKGKNYRYRKVFLFLFSYLLPHSS